MERTPELFQELLAQSRQSFLSELPHKLNKITGWVNSLNSQLSSDMIQEFLRLFHSMHGTASTLELDRLAELGREGKKLTLNISSGGVVDLPLYAKNLKGILNDIEHQLQLNKFISQIEFPTKIPKEYTNMPESPKILLVDDDTTILNLLENAFTSEGYTVYICDDSLTAMDIVVLSKPDVIILDIMMPKVDGYDILSQIKKRREYSDICVIFLSALDELDSKIKGMNAGVDDYITKPFNLKEVVTRVEMVLRRAQKYKEKLLKDSLTGAFSRSYLNERFKDELDRFKRNKTLFSAAFIDLDFFKHINDEYGHSTGDFVLKEFVEFMISNLRESDCLFRFGGEEFVVLLPDTNESQAYNALERMRQTFSKKTHNFAGNIFCVTFSCGIKEVDEKDKSVNQLLSMVDEVMYAAKNAGRNRVICYSNLKNGRNIKKTLLLVDDESTILKLLSERLTEAGYNLILSSTGQEALNLIKERSIDAVVLDLILPDMNGLEICRTIKENAQTRNTRVVILSQKSRTEEKVEGLISGADDYVTKPFSMAELEARIMRVLKR